MRVYLSSTSTDLKPFRESVLSALRRMGHEAAAMEDYQAEDQYPADKCVADVAASQLYVGVFAWRYGFVPAERQVSITEMEYLTAKEKSIPTLIFLLDPEVSWPPKFIEKGPGASKIEGLRERLMKAQLVSMFSSPEDLAAKVATAVAKAAETAEKKRAPARRAAAPAWTLAQLQERAHKASEDYLDKMQRERIFLPQVYIPRAELESHLDGFAEARCTKTGMLIVGASGVGKTNTLCHWVRRRQESAERPQDILLFLGGSTLPGGHLEVRQAILDRFEASGSIADFLEAFGSLRASSDAQLIIVIDSVDKHPQAGELLRQIDQMIVLEEVITWFKVVVSIGEVAYATQRKAGFIPARRDYYLAPRKNAAPGAEAYEISLGPLTAQELPAAYASYIKEPGFAPTSTFEDLAEEVKTSLRSPLFLRIVMELFNGRKIPRRVLSTEVLLEYCTKKVFQHSDRAFFVNRFVDLLFDKRLSTAGYDLLTREPDLRMALLDGSSESTYLQLLDEQVLEEQTKRVSSILPPQRSVAFAYDRLFEYLLLTRLADRYGMQPEALIRLSREASAYLPAHGVLTTLLSAKLDEGRAEEAAAVLRDGEPEVMRAIARRLFAELEHASPMPPAGAPADAPLGRLIVAMVQKPTPFAVELLIAGASELRKLGYLRRAASVYEALSPVLPATLEPRLKAAFHRGAGMVKSLGGRKAEALSELESALALYRAASDRDGEQAMLDAMGRIQLDLGKLEQARELLEASLKIDREAVAATGSAEAREGEAESLYHLSSFFLMDGQPQKAIERAEESRRIRAALGDRRAIADSLLQVGLCQRRLGQLEEALASASETLAIYREVGSKLGLGSSLAELGQVHGALGRREEALSCLQEALSLFKEIGNTGGIAAVLGAIGAAKRESGDHEAAVRNFSEALGLYRAIEHRAGSAACLVELGSTFLLEGHAEKAIDSLTEARALFKESVRLPGQSRCLAYLAAASADLGRKEEALAHGELAVKALEDGGLGEEDRQIVHFYRFKTLKALGMNAEAEAALQDAHEGLMREAQAIRSEETRKAFLESARLRQAIRQARAAPKAG